MQTRQSKWIPKKHHPSHLEQVVFLVMEACKDQALYECSFIWPPIRTEYLVITTVVAKIGICLESRMGIISFHRKNNWFRADYWLPFISQTFMCSGRETCYLLFPSSWGGCSTWNVAEAKSIRWTPKRVRSNQSQPEEQKEQLWKVGRKLMFLNDENFVIMPPINENLCPGGQWSQAMTSVS